MEIALDNPKPDLARKPKGIRLSLRNKIYGSFTMNKERLLGIHHSSDAANCARNPAFLKMTGFERSNSSRRHRHTDFPLKNTYPVEKSLQLLIKPAVLLKSSHCNQTS